MKEEDKRAVALNSLTSIGKEYVTLSDSTTIGKDVLEDLKKLMELELREKYKVNKTKWRVITPNKTSDEKTLSGAYHVITGNEKFMNEFLKKFNENQEKINKIEKEITVLESNKKTDTSKYKKVLNELKELKKFFVIDMVPDIPISFNTIVQLYGEGEENEPVYCAPYIELNKDPKEIATILNDKKELDKIFREKQFKSFDDMVILDFYNEITKKLSDTKDYLRKTDPDIRQDIIDDLYNKLFALYDIKEYYFKDKVKEKDEIKEKYIKEKIRKNNNLSIGGGSSVEAIRKGVSGAAKVLNTSATKTFVNAVESKKDDGRGTRAAKQLLATPVAASVGLAADSARLATLGTYKTLEGVGTGLYKGSKAVAKGLAYAQDKTPNLSNLLNKASDSYDSFQRRKKEKAEKYFEIDKLLHTITESIKNKSADEIEHVLNIKTLRELSDELNDNSIYKKNIEELIDIHDSLLSSNRDTLLAEQEEEAEEYIGKKKEASGEFVLKAVEKYKQLKKSFVDKVNKDKDDIEKMLEEEAGGDFADEISFNDIVNNNSGTYIKKLKNMNSFLYLLEKKKNPKKTGGAAPMYDIQKLKKDDGIQEVSGNTPFDYYRKLKDNYIEIVNLYYKLINDIGGEEKHYKFIYDYESLGIESFGEDDEDNNKKKSDNDESNKNKEELKKVYDFIYKRLDSISTGSAKLFTNEDRPINPEDDYVIKKYATVLGVKQALAKDADDPEGKITLKLRDELLKGDYDRKGFVQWKSAGTSGKNDIHNAMNIFFSDLDSSLNRIQNCYDKDSSDIKNEHCNILTKIKEIFSSGKETDVMQNKINVLEAKIQLVKDRIEVLNELITKLPIELQKIYKTTKDMKGQAQATEYEDHVINILKRDKIEFFEKDKDKDKHPIIKQLNNELALRKQQLEKFQRELNQAEKEKVYKLEKLKAEQKGAPGIYVAQGEQKAKKDIYPSDSSNDLNGGAPIKKDSNTKKYEDDLGLSSEELKNKHKSFRNLISEDKENDLNLHYLMKNLKSDVEYLENNDEANKDSDKSIDIGSDRGIYEDIWHDYKLSVNKKDNKTEKWKNYLLYLTEGEKVHDRVIQNNLDPEIVLKIDFRDKSIYIFLMFLIRTINIIALEFLIEYNIIKSLQYTIMLYGFMYLFIITLLVILVNYDSYKLRILFNYLNIHINSSNLLLQNVLFIIFIILVYILVKSDEFLKYFGDLFDFTNIYNNIYKFNESLNEDSDINLTQNEKLKLLYRIDIISMIIFIFSAFLVLIL